MPDDHLHELGWIMIPPMIVAATDLSMGEKVVCGRVIGLIGKRGYCFASNEWLGKQLGYSDRTIEDVRHCLGLISLRERELADAAGAARERPYFTDEKTAADVVPISKIGKTPKKRED